MKNLLLATACSLAIFNAAQAQTKTSEPAVAEMINFPVAGEEDGNAYLIKAKKESNKYLIVLHEWWGLNEQTKKKADELAKAMPYVNVLAVDIYDGRVAVVPEDTSKYLSQISSDRVNNILKGALTYTGKKANVQTIGWGIGGNWSLQTAMMAGKNAKGCVMYYCQPETDPKKLKSLKTDVLGIYAKKDQWATPKMATDFQKSMKEAGKVTVVKQFESDHAFANATSPNFNSKNAAAADKMALDYLKKRFSDKK